MIVMILRRRCKRKGENIKKKRRSKRKHKIRRKDAKKM